MSTQVNRIATPFTNEHFADFCLKMIGQPYWYGTVVYKCSENLRSRKAHQYPTHYSSSRTARYKQDISAKKVCADCVGGCKGYAWSNGGQGVLESIGTDKTYSSKYGANNCPDKSANDMFSYAKSKGMDWGSLSTLPDIVGLALHKDGHVGYTVGGGYAVEWRGYAYGCVKTKIAGRGWTNWYMLPFINYGEYTGTTNPPTIDVALGSRLLKKGMGGADVKALQECLLQLGYALSKYGVDSNFGTETETAVKAFQTEEGLVVDGKYGDKSHKALMDAVADIDDATKDDPTSGGEAGESAKRVVIVSEGGKVNIRTDNSTDYSCISTVAPGATFEYVATADNGWHAVVIAAMVGWVSGKYSKIV